MPAVQNILVIGAGVAGTAAAIQLAEAGVQVEIAEHKTEIAALGSGITLQGNALRVLRQLGVWDQVQAHGYGFDTLGLRAPDPAGTLLVELPDIRSGGPDLPATMGMPRPELATILADRAAAAGARLRLGTHVTSLAGDDEGVTVTFGDGSTGRYDLVIGADGLHSHVREAIGITERPQPTGMAIWRVFAPRPASVTRTDLFYGGPAYITGYCPTSENSLYAYIVEDHHPADGALSPDEQVDRMVEASRAYHGPWDDIRPSITHDRGVNWTAFETHVVDGPWHRGRVVLIGDAVHSCPPTLAQGAAMALEDAVVLAELLVREDALSEKLFAEFTDRRLPRAKTVVEASNQLGAWLLAHDREADTAGLIHRIAMLVSEPA